MSAHNRDRRRRRRLSNDGKTTWDYRAAGDEAVFGNVIPDWMEVPVDIPGNRRRRVLRQYQSPSPASDKMVTNRKLEGNIWVWEDPDNGFIFANSPDAKGKPKVSIEDAKVTKDRKSDDGVEVIESEERAVVSTSLPGVNFVVSAKTQLWLAQRFEGQGRILIVTPEVLNDFVRQGYLIKRDGVYYLVDEVS